MRIARTAIRPELARHASRPPHAVVGSQINTEEQIFAAFDGRIMRRFWAFIRAYRRQLVLAILAVLAFAASQIAIPLILRTVIDDALVGGALVGGANDERLLALGVLVFFGIVTLNFLANMVQETLVARIAERLLINLRRAAYAHLQRVSLSFMDKTVPIVDTLTGAAMGIVVVAGGVAVLEGQLDLGVMVAFLSASCGCRKVTKRLWSSGAETCRSGNDS